MDRYRAYKYRSVSSEQRLRRTLDIISNRRLYCARWTDLNDPMEGTFEVLKREGYEEAIEERLSKLLSEKPKFRICALSLNPYDRNMLSTYGDGHRGVIIEVELPLSESIVEVVYGDSHPEIDLLPGKIKDKAVEVFRYKHSDYAHEKELRIVFEKEFYSLQSNVKSVRLGANIGSKEKTQIEEACRALDIPVYQADEHFARTECVGNIFWIGSELATAWREIRGKDRHRISECLRKVLYHADQLSFSDTSFQEKLKGLIAEVNGTNEDQLTLGVRKELASKCHQLRIGIAEFLVGFQPNFKAPPDALVDGELSPKRKNGDEKHYSKTTQIA